MLEFPEVITVAKQINNNVAGKRIRRVLPPTKAHKFCWYAGDPADYDAKMSGSTVQEAEGFGIYVEVTLDNGSRLCFNDGVNARLIDCDEAPKNYQLLVEFAAGIHPKRKIGSFGALDQERLLSCIISVLNDMGERGGRDTEKDLFGQPGGYRTKLSKNTLASGCPRCGGQLVREAYLGGAVYYCPVCQPLAEVCKDG